MRDAVIISLIFHVVVMFSGLVALPMFKPDRPTKMRVIPVEMVRIADVTKLRAQEKRPDPVKKKTVVKKKAPERKVEMPPAPPKLVSSMPLPDMKAKPKPKKKTETKKPIKQATNRAPRVTPKVKPSRFDAGKLAALLDKREKAEPNIIEQLKDKDYANEKVISTLDIQQQTLSIIDAIDKHIYDNQCWNIPAGAKGAAGLRVTVHVRLSPDGKLIGPPKVLDSGRMNLAGQEFYRTAAESALRAVRKCAPFDFLPKAQYDLWRDMEIIFDPENILNG
ncbi:MAG: hypothetical protein COB54_00600 [Alphaproteobacteria bacterium]|nr:MAG: hypothetical protein COB54_00600 [Alphaproteobacteria bacterium]